MLELFARGSVVVPTGGPVIQEARFYLRGTMAGNDLLRARAGRWVVLICVDVTIYFW